MPASDEWGATVQIACRLVGQLEPLAAPVDLVGHDWGDAFAVLVAMSRPDLLRSRVSDAIGVFNPGYLWHDLWLTWQTPGAGGVPHG
jgi:pimeloyl-ACP methyl ester carboxylesterase